MNNDVGNGLVLVQHSPDRAVQFDGNSPFYGWLFWHHPDGNWVSMSKLSPFDMTQAEDQRDSDIVIDGGHNVMSKSGGLRCG